VREKQINPQIVFVCFLEIAWLRWKPVHNNIINRIESLEQFTARQQNYSPLKKNSPKRNFPAGKFLARKLWMISKYTSICWRANVIGQVPFRKIYHKQLRTIVLSFKFQRFIVSKFPRIKFQGFNVSRFLKYRFQMFQSLRFSRFPEIKAFKFSRFQGS
jgi:hypothetical protein